MNEESGRRPEGRGGLTPGGADYLIDFTQVAVLSVVRQVELSADVAAQNTLVVQSRILRVDEAIDCRIACDPDLLPGCKDACEGLSGEAVDQDVAICDKEHVLRQGPEKGAASGVRIILRGRPHVQVGRGDLDGAFGDDRGDPWSSGGARAP